VDRKRWKRALSEALEWQRRQIVTMSASGVIVFCILSLDRLYWYAKSIAHHDFWLRESREYLIAAFLMILPVHLSNRKHSVRSWLLGFVMFFVLMGLLLLYKSIASNA
jgi:hypothetical protein